MRTASSARMTAGALALALLLNLSLAARPAPAATMDEANRQFVHERFADALTAYRTIADSTAGIADASRAEALYLAGRCLQEMIHWEEALHTFREVTRRFPDSPWRHYAYLRIGDCYAEQPDWNAAMFNYSNAATIAAPTEVQALARLNRGAIVANSNNRLTDWTQAESDLQFAIRNLQDPDVLVQAYFAQGELNRNQSNLTEALRYYEKAATISANGVWGAMARNVIAQLNARLGNNDIAVEQLKQIAGDERSPSALNIAAQRQLSEIQRDSAPTAVPIAAARTETTDAAIHYRGEVVVRLPEATVRCAEATLDRRTRALECRGGVTLEGERLGWSLSTGRLRLDLAPFQIETPDER